MDRKWRAWCALHAARETWHGLVNVKPPMHGPEVGSLLCPVLSQEDDGLVRRASSAPQGGYVELLITLPYRALTGRIVVV